MIDWLTDQITDWMLTPTQWIKLNTVFLYFKPLKEVTSLYFFYEHGVQKSTVASLHNQAQFHLY